MSSHLTRGLVAGNSVRFLAVEASEVVDACAAAHGLSPDARRIVAEAIVATALMSAHIKGNERITLQIQAETPRFSYMGEIDAEGAVRARFTPLHATYGPVTGGMLAIKSDAERETYRGLSAIRDQKLGDALASHFATSDQVDVVLFVDGAHGVLFERLPAAEGHPTIDHEAFRARFTSPDIPDDAEIFDVRPLVWRCRCSAAKVHDTLRAMGDAEVRAMIAEGGASVTCHFCNTTYRVSVAELERLLSAGEA